MHPVLLPISFVVVLLSGVALAHTGATGVVKERMEMMKSVAEDMKQIAKMMKGETAFSGPSVATAAERIAKHASTMPDLFPEGSTQKPSEALPVIWTDWDGFVQIFDEFRAAASRLAEVAVDAETPQHISSQFKMVADSCGDCHKKYRQKK